MARRTTRLAVTSLIFATVATAAWAAGSGPKPGGYYPSASPSLSIAVGKPATTVSLYVECRPSPAVADYWDSPKLRLKHDAFSFDAKTTVDTENGATFGHYKGTILFTGKFSGGEFRGSEQIVGSVCAKRSYTAKYDKNGGGGSGK
jgi:hypothetical protein